MKVVGNQEGLSQGKKLFTGLTNMKILMVNPTHSQLKVLFGENAKEPNYSSNSDDGEVTRLDVYLKQEEVDIITKVVFFISNRDRRPSRSGNTQFVNDLGQFKWASSLEEIEFNDYFADANPRAAKEGQEKVYELFQAFARYNYRQEGAMFIMDWENLVAGDCSSLNNFITENDENRVACVLTVQEKSGNHYQQVSNRFFMQASTNLNSERVRLAHENYAITKDMFTYKFQEFNREDCIGVAPTETVSSFTDMKAAMLGN